MTYAKIIVVDVILYVGMDCDLFSRWNLNGGVNMELDGDIILFQQLADVKS